jgi:predicted enzyme related to lactoylglutathione lyase
MCVLKRVPGAMAVPGFCAATEFGYRVAAGSAGERKSMKRVTGIGGIFFHAKDPAALRAWYQAHLGIDVQAWGGTAFEPMGATIWSIGAAGPESFAPSTAPFMINYRVDDLAAVLQALRDEGCNVLEKVDDSEYGKFGWVMDPEGNKVELWEPPPGQ